MFNRDNRNNRAPVRRKIISSSHEEHSKLLERDRKWEFSQDDIIFEDENYIVVNKPEGIPVHATLDKRRPNLYDKIVTFLKNRDQATLASAVPYVGIHHRLDRDTTGLVLFTKRKEANPHMADLFENRKIIKKYIGVIKNSLNPDTGKLEDYLAKTKSKKGEKVVRVFRGGDKAITNYEVLERFSDSSLVSFELFTGRMHQIRVQTSVRNAPIVGDEMYGDERFNVEHRVRRQLLHANYLEFFDAFTNKTLKIEAPIPEDIKKWLKKRRTENTSEEK